MVITQVRVQLVLCLLHVNKLKQASDISSKVTNGYFIQTVNVQYRSRRS